MLKDVLRKARNERNLKQEEVAKLVGVTKQTYLKWESGTTEPKASQVAKLSNILKITADEICQGDMYERYSLEEFINKLTKYRSSREMEVLEVWKCIPNHRQFFNEVNNTNCDELEKIEMQKRGFDISK